MASAVRNAPLSRIVAFGTLAKTKAMIDAEPMSGRAGLWKHQSSPAGLFHGTYVT